MNWKFTAAGVMATAVAGVLKLTTPPVPVDQASPQVRRAAAARPSSPTADISEEALRLRARVREELAYREPSRNPFRFGERRAAAGATSAPARTPASPVAEVPEVVPPPPPIVLSGVATSVVDGASRRTAILGTLQGVLLVREGDAVGAEYRVVTVEQEAIVLVTPAGVFRRIDLATR